MTGEPMSVQDAFFAYAKGKISLSPKLLSDYLQKASDYCHLKQPLMGMTDVIAVRKIQQKIAEGKLLRFRFGKEAQTIRNVTQLYYNFVKSYRELKEQTDVPEELLSSVLAVENPLINDSDSIAPVQVTESSVPVSSEVMKNTSSSSNSEEDLSNELWIDFTKDASFPFTKPNYYIYKGQCHEVKSWNKLYVEVCGLLFADHQTAFMGIMNGDVPGYNALAFADEQHKSNMRVARQFAPGYYLESNIDATTIIRRIRGLHHYFNLGDALRISYAKTDGNQLSVIPDVSEEEWIITQLKELKITYQDKRNMSGCLWIVGGHELDHFMMECKSHGYEMHYKLDGYKAFPGKPAWWTTSRTAPVKKAEQHSTASNVIDLESFKQFLQNEQHLAERTANSYCSAIRAIDDMLKRNNPGLTLLSSNPDEVQNIINRLIKNPSFGHINEERHHQLSAAMAQYLSYVKDTSSKQKTTPVQKERTIIEAVFEALKMIDLPLTFQQINDTILKNDLYQFNTPNSIGMIRHAVYTHCLTTKERIANGETVIIQVSNNGLNKYQLMNANEASLFLYGKPVSGKKSESEPPKPIEPVQSDRDEKLIAEAEKIVAQADLDGLTVEQLAFKLDSTVVAAKKAVADTTNIVAVDGKLIHKDAFMDWEENADILESILDKLMAKNNGYVSNEQLFDYARMNMQMFINDHGMDTSRKIYDLAEHLFDKEGYHGKRYSFIGKTHISRKGEAVTSKLDIMKKFARDNGGIFTLHELEDYLTTIGLKNENLRQQMKLYEQPIFLYIEEGTFITTESMGLDDAYLEKMHIALKRLFSDGGDHVVLRDIQTSWFNLLPALPQGKEWTPLLLQSVLRFYSKECGARTIYGLINQAGDTLHAMVVSNRSEIQTFGDAVIAMLLDGGISQRQFEAEELRHLLVDRGMVSGNELIWNMPKALPNDGRFAWDSDGQHVTINI